MSTTKIWLPSELKKYDGPLLLDTHIWIWYLQGNETRLAPDTVSLLDRVGRASGLHVSDISYWEVAVKAAKGKLELSMDVAIWLKRAELTPGIRFLALDRDTLLLSTKLHGAVHNDPADRLLIAAAQLRNTPLVTADALIVEYARRNAGTPIVDARLTTGKRRR